MNWFKILLLISGLSIGFISVVELSELNENELLAPVPQKRRRGRKFRTITRIFERAVEKVVKKEVVKILKHLPKLINKIGIKSFPFEEDGVVDHIEFFDSMKIIIEEHLRDNKLESFSKNGQDFFRQFLGIKEEDNKRAFVRNLTFSDEALEGFIDQTLPVLSFYMPEDVKVELEHLVSSDKGDEESTDFIS